MTIPTLDIGQWLVGPFGTEPEAKQAVDDLTSVFKLAYTAFQGVDTLQGAKGKWYVTRSVKPLDIHLDVYRREMAKQGTQP